MNETELGLEFQAPPGWVCWAPGLSPEALRQMAEASDGAKAEEATLAIASLDEMARADDSVDICGLWFPETAQHRIAATLLVRTYPSHEPAEEQVAEYLKISEQPPPMPGCLISDYAVFDDRADLGPLICHILLYADEKGQPVWLTRYTVFSQTSPMCAEFDFNLINMRLADEMHESAGLLVASARHSEGE